MSMISSRTCAFCGSTFTLFSISNRSMDGLTKVWKKRHERYCKNKTVKQRLATAKKYIGLTSLDSSIVVDLNHQGYKNDN